jgi:hypothetical protein
MGFLRALKDDIRSLRGVQSSEGVLGWLAMLFGIAANGLSDHMPCLSKRLFYTDVKDYCC